MNGIALTMNITLLLIGMLFVFAIFLFCYIEVTHDRDIDKEFDQWLNQRDLDEKNQQQSSRY